MQPIRDPMELFRHQRAVRAWSDQPVPEKLVEQVLQAAIHAPSGSNTQPWHFIVVRKERQKSRIGTIYEQALHDTYGDAVPPRAANRMPLERAPVLIVVCVDTPPLGHAGFQTGASIYPACQNLMLAARALGLGTVLTTLHRRRKAAIHELLEIPEGVETAAIIPLGWPTQDYGPNHRDALNRVVMHEHWTA